MEKKIYVSSYSVETNNFLRKDSKQKVRANLIKKISEIWEDKRIFRGF